MRYSLSILLVAMLAMNALAQVNYIPNTTFSLVVDSIERNVSETKRYVDTSYYIHYTVTNLSADTLVYVTNSCFYYNHCILTSGQTAYDINPRGGCFSNITTNHYLKPGEKLRHAQWSSAKNMNTLTTGILNIQLVIPLVKEGKRYTIDGRGYAKNIEQLIFEGQTKVVQADKRKKRRKKTS